jgi:hypothetical protein
VKKWHREGVAKKDELRELFGDRGGTVRNADTFENSRLSDWTIAAPLGSLSSR